MKPMKGHMTYPGLAPYELTPADKVAKAGQPGKRPTFFPAAISPLAWRNLPTA
jgi:hypothetical protein